MSGIKDGGSVFPTLNALVHVSQTRSEAVSTGGMTLRDYFAAKAMQGICAHPDTWGLLTHEITEHAYDIADAMLRARGQS